MRILQIHWRCIDKIITIQRKNYFRVSFRFIFMWNICNYDDCLQHIRQSFLDIRFDTKRYSTLHGIRIHLFNGQLWIDRFLLFTRMFGICMYLIHTLGVIRHSRRHCVRLCHLECLYVHIEHQRSIFIEIFKAIHSIQR